MLDDLPGAVLVVDDDAGHALDLPIDQREVVAAEISRIWASGSREEASRKPSTAAPSRFTCWASRSGDSSKLARTSVNPAAEAWRSAPRIRPKKDGLVMSGTSSASVPVPRELADRDAVLGR
ncbi:hypothetical protein ACFQ0G_10500 [Streptomyces chiangmaiensis]